MKTSEEDFFIQSLKTEVKQKEKNIDPMPRQLKTVIKKYKDSIFGKKFIAKIFKARGAIRGRIQISFIQ